MGKNGLEEARGSTPKEGLGQFLPEVHVATPTIEFLAGSPCRKWEGLRPGFKCSSTEGTYQSWKRSQGSPPRQESVWEDFVLESQETYPVPTEPLPW